MSRELEVLREEYKRALEDPVFNDPKDYTILLNLIQDRMEEIGRDMGISKGNK